MRVPPTAPVGASGATSATGGAARGGRPDLRLAAVGAAAWTGALLGRSTDLPAVPSRPLAAVLTGVAVGAVLAGALAVRAASRARGHRYPGPDRGSSPRRALTVVGLLLALAAGVTAAALRGAGVGEGPVADLATQGAVATVEARVVGDPRPVRGGFEEQVAVRITVVDVTGRGQRHRLRSPVLVLGDPGTWGAATLGSRVRTTGRLVASDDPDLAALLVGPGPPDVVAPPGAAWRAADRLRSAVREAVAHRPPEQAALVPALVDGDDADLDPALVEDFATTGLTHLTAVSGTNLTLVVGSLLVLARWVGVRGRWLVVVGACGVAGFVLLARTEPSVLRAAAMGTVGLLAFAVDGRDRALRALGVTVLVLVLAQPSLAASAGFALSVLATAGIVLLGPGIRDALAAWAPRVVAEAVAVPLAAQLACTPVVAAISEQVSLVAVAANLLVGPVVAPATVLGLLGGLVGLVSPSAARVPGTLAAWCVAWLVVVARRGAALPLPALGWGSGPVALAVLVGLTAVVALAAPRLLRHRAATLAVVAVMAVVVAARPSLPGGGLLPGALLPGGWPPQGWRAAMCDVGQGDALVLRSGPDRAVVVDAGPDPGLVDRCLDRLGVLEVPLVVLTHFHADHVDGLPGVLADREVGQVVSTRVLDPPAGVAAVGDATSAAGMAPVGVVATGTTVRAGAVTLQVLWPEAGPATDGAGDGSAANDASVVLLAEVDGVRLLLTGDVEPPAQARLEALLGGAELDVDVLKVPHHGSAHQDLSWLTALRPSAALVSVGAGNDYGHPAVGTVSALTAAGADVHRTDQDGALAVVPGPEGGVEVVPAGP